MKIKDRADNPELISTTIRVCSAKLELVRAKIAREAARLREDYHHGIQGWLKKEIKLNERILDLKKGFVLEIPMKIPKKDIKKKTHRALI